MKGQPRLAHSSFQTGCSTELCECAPQGADVLPITNELRAEHLTREGNTKPLADLLFLSPVPRCSFDHDGLQSAAVLAEPLRYIADVQTALFMYTVDVLRPDSIDAE